MESVGNRTLPAKYKFGDVATFKYMKCDRIIEADIVTDTGSWTFNSNFTCSSIREFLLNKEAIPG